jgi:hypothetical protein
MLFARSSTWKFIHYGSAQVPKTRKKADKKSGASKGVYEVHG